MRYHWPRIFEVKPPKFVPEPFPPNTLYHGDNFESFQRYIADESVGPINPDPPFNSAAQYKALLAEKDRTYADAQIKGFENTPARNLAAGK
jgi:hypothetical protein